MFTLAARGATSIIKLFIMAVDPKHRYSNESESAN